MAPPNMQESNRRLWDELAAQAVANLPATGAADLNGLTSLELAEVGPVAGKRLLHLQCHVGLAALSWARLGAQVTGVDFSVTAIAAAQRLSREMNLPATFLAADLYDLPGLLPGPFDVVFTSFGVLSWLPDLTAWAKIIAAYLKPGGFFYLAEFHPLARVFREDAQRVKDLRLAYSYFTTPEPLTWEIASPDSQRALSTAHSFEWNHSLGEIVTALARAGLRLEFLHEFAFCSEQLLPCLVQGPDNWWRLPDHDGSLPLMFSLKAHKAEMLNAER